MTTDTVTKSTTVNGDGFVVGGIAKGAAMLEPNMATMLAVLTTDAFVEPATATRLLQGAVATSFNCLTVDGAESTNDSALLAALIFDRGLDHLGDTIVEVAAGDPDARLNIVAANGSRMLATTWGDTLSVLRRPDGVVIASEPYDDDPSWQEVPDRHLVDVTGTEVTLTPLRGL